MATVKIIEEVLKALPSDANIAEAVFEGSNIVLYTKNKEFFLDSKDYIRKIVDDIKKRVEVRADPSIVDNIEDAKAKIEKALPEEAGKPNIIFDPQRSRVIIEAEKPGLAIGKSGETLKEIKKACLWTPIVRRIPPIRCQLIENIRQVLYDYSDYRKKFLHKVGKRVYEGWTKTKRDEWVRMTCLGSAREVGRSAFLLQTPESKVLLDCGFNVAAPRELAFPYLDAPEFNIQELDAVIISHPHIDHCLPPNTPVELEGGVLKPIDEVKEGDKLITINWKTGKKETGECIKNVRTYTHKEVIKVKTNYFNIEASPNHKFFVIDNMEIKEVEAGCLKEGMIIPCDPGNYNDLNIVKLLNSVDYRERIDFPQEAKTYFRNLRKQENFTQGALCKTLNKSRNRIYEIENKNNSIYLNELRLLLNFYNLNEVEFCERFGIKKLALPERLNYELSQCLGYLAGDGHKATENSLIATDKNKSCLTAYSNLVNNIFNYEPIIAHHSDKMKNAFVIRICNAGIKRYIEKNFNSLLVDSPIRDIPNSITLSSNEIIRGFIRGFADAEGCVKDNSIDIDSSSIKLIEQVQFMLNRLGIRTTLSKSKIKGIVKYYYRATISSIDGIIKFNELIGFNHPEKIMKLNKLVNSLKDKNERSTDILPFDKYNIKSIIKSIGLGSGYLRKTPNLIRILPKNVLAIYNGYSNYLTNDCAMSLEKFLSFRINNIKQALHSNNLKIKRLCAGLGKYKLGALVGLKIHDVTKAENNKNHGNNTIFFDKLNDI